MAATVQIEIMVDESGAVTGFRSLNAAGAQVQTTIKAVGTAGTQMGAQVSTGADQGTLSVQKLAAAWGLVTPAAEAAGNAGAAAGDKIRTHTLTGLDSARLLRDELGFRIPRAMEIVIGKSTVLSGLLSKVTGAMVAFGFAGIGLEVAEKFVEIGEEIFKADDAVVQFNEHLADTAGKKFMDTQSVEDARDGIAQVNDDLKQTQLQLNALPSSQGAQLWAALKTGGVSLSSAGIAGTIAQAMTMGGLRTSRDAIANTDQERSDQDRYQIENAQHAKNIANLDVESKKYAAIHDQRLRALKEEGVEEQKNAENRRHSVATLGIDADINHRAYKPGQTGYVPSPAANAGAEAEGNANAVARAGLSATDTELSQQEMDEIRRLQDQANNASLHGFQLLEAQKAEALDEFTRKYGASAAARRAIDDKFNAEEMEQQRQIMRQIEDREREATLAGQTGLLAIQTKGANKLSDINDDLSSGKYAAAGDQAAQEAAADRDRVTAKKQTDEDVVKEEQRFQDQLAQIVEQSTSKQLQGFARIRSDGEKQLDALQKKFEDVYGGLAPSSPVYQSGQVDLNKAKAQVTGGTESQTVQLAQKNANETAKIERDAYAASLPESQQREQQIRNTYNDRVDAYKQMLSEQQISQTDFDARVMAAQKEMNAQMAAAAKQERDKLASEIEPLLSGHPLEALEKLGAHAAAQIGADEIMKLNGGHAPGATGGKGKRGGFFDFPMLGAGHGSHDAQPGGAHAAESMISSMTVRATSVTVYGDGAGGGSGVSGSIVHAGGMVTPIGTPTSTRSVGFSPASAGVLGTLPGASASGIPGAAGGWSGGGGIPANIASAPGQDGTVGITRSTDVLSGDSSSGIPGSSGGGGWSGGGGAGMTPAQGGDEALPPNISGGGGAAVVGDDAMKQVSGGALPTASKAITGGAGATVLKDANGAMGMAQSAQQLGNTLWPSGPGNGPNVTASGSGPMQGVNGAMSTAMPYAQAGLGLFSAAESNGGLSGALGGAMSGAKLGLMLGGPMGAAIGAVGGAILGVIGIGGMQKANQYNDQTVKPQISNDLIQFGMGAMTYQAAYDDLTKLDMDSKKQVAQWGTGGKRVYADTIEGEIKSAQSQLTREQKAGRSQYGMGAAEFHGGGVIGGFGDYATGPDEGWIHAKRGETVMHSSATEMHGDALSLMLAGANRGQMSSYYGAQQMQPSYRAAMQQSAFGGGGHTFNNGHTYNINAIDTQSFASALHANKHSVRGAVNASYAENSGGSDLG